MSEPCWKTDFPVSRPSEHRSARRQFLQFLGLGGLTVALGAFAKKLFAKDAPEYPRVEVVPRNQIQHGYHLFRYPTEHDPAILVELADGTLRAYSQRCTHLLCPVHFKPETQSLFCPCHKGSFDATDGSVQYGPPPKPLPQFEVAVRDGRVWVLGKEKK